MFLGVAEIRQNVKGTFEKFYFRVTLKRTEKTRHFKCFKGNDELSHTEIDFIYARSGQDATDMFVHWSKFYNDDSWKYESVPTPFLKKVHMTIESIIEDFRSVKPNRLIQYEDNVREIIH